jgi:hypothetical protein
MVIAQLESPTGLLQRHESRVICATQFCKPVPMIRQIRSVRHSRNSCIPQSLLEAPTREADGHASIRLQLSGGCIPV